MKDKNIHISFSNKVPQWAIRQTHEGALQPKTAGTASHPELLPNQDLLSLLGRNTRTAKTEAEMEADLQQISKVSPAVKYIASSELNIKRASVNSKNESERWAAVQNSQCGASAHTTSEALIPNVIRPVRTGSELASDGHSKFASRLPGGTSMTDAEITSTQTPSDMISEFSRDSIRLAKKTYASKYEKSLSPEEVREQQKSRTIGRDSLFGMSTCMFSSSKQAFTPAENNLDNTYDLFRKKTTAEKISPELNHLATELAGRLNDRVSSMRKNKHTWDQAAVKDIDSRLKHAASKSARIVEAEEQQRQEKYSREAPSLDKLTWALTKDAPKVADNKSETIQHTASRNLKISQRTTQKKTANISSVSRPTTSIVDNMLSAVVASKPKGDNSGYEVI